MLAPHQMTPYLLSYCLISSGGHHDDVLAFSLLWPDEEPLMIDQKYI